MSGILKGIKTILGDVEMVPYTVVADHETYEERLYPAKKWVCNSVQCNDRESAVSSMFRILFNYISGKNKPNIRIDMTTPVTTYVESKEGKEQTKYTMGFLIAEEHQDNPPDPADPIIFIENRSDMRVVTRRFGGFTTEANVQKEVKDLTEILKAAGEEGVAYSEFYIAGYDPPYKLINRRNEIWFVKTPSEGVKKAPEGEEVVS